MSRPVKVHLAAALLIASCAVASARTAQIDNKLNLRQGPGPEHRVIVVMPAGATVNVGECRGEWCQVEYRGQRGYANSALLSGGDAALAAAPAAAPAAGIHQVRCERRGAGAQLERPRVARSLLARDGFAQAAQ